MSLVAVRDLWTDPQVVAGRLKRVRNEQWGKGRRWQVRWRDADQVQRKRNFATADGAEAFWAELQLSPRERASRRTVAEQYELWLSAKTVKASTRADYEQKWRLRVSEFGPRQVASLTHAEIAQWVGEMSRAVSASTTRRAYVVLSGVLDMAVRDGAIPANPCTGVRLPRLERGEMRFLTVDQVARLAEECAPHGLVVWTLALTGIRWGELCALTPADLDGTRLRIARSVSWVDGEKITTTPKAGRGRDVAVPAWLAAELAKVEGEWLLATSRGNQWRQSSWKRIWRTHKVDGVPVDGAIERAGLHGLRVHDLRHTYASLAVAAGADVKTVQRQLGHASASMTLDTYAGLFDRSLDDAAARLNDVSRVALSGH